MGLALGFGQQILGVQVALQHHQARGDGFGQVLHQGPLGIVGGAEQRQLQHTDDEVGVLQRDEHQHTGLLLAQP